jgi:hypothetical protein
MPLDILAYSSIRSSTTTKKEEMGTSYDKEKYCDLLLDAVETALGYFWI